MAATARVIFQCACVRYLLGRVPPFLLLKVMLHKTTRNHNIQCNRELQHCCDIVSNTRGTRLRCVALKIVVPCNRLHYLYEYFQEPITRSEQLPYQAYVKAFLRTSLFLDIFLGTFSRSWFMGSLYFIILKYAFLKFTKFLLFINLVVNCAVISVIFNISVGTSLQSYRKLKGIIFCPSPSYKPRSQIIIRFWETDHVS